MDYDSLERRVEETIVKYIRRFLEMGQWVKDKITDEAIIREREIENKRKDKLIMNRIDRMEKRIVQMEKRIEKDMKMIRGEVREIREMIIGVRIETEQEEDRREGEVEENAMQKKQRNED